MTSRRPLGLAVLVVLMTLRAPPTSATLLVPTPMMVLAARSDAIVIGRVHTIEARWEGRRIVTHAAVVIEARAKGSVPDRIDVVLPGGVVDGIGMRVLGAATIVEGERALLFLAPADRTDGRRHLLELSGGKVAIERDAHGVDHVRDDQDRLRQLSDLVPELSR